MIISEYSEKQKTNIYVGPLVFRAVFSFIVLF